MTSTWLSADTLVRKYRPAQTPLVEDHRLLLEGDFWRRIPAYREVEEDTFLDHRWQAKASVTRAEQLYSVLRELVSDGFYQELVQGLARAPMSVRISPYILSLIDWEHPASDPLRRQFLPLASELLADHPMARLDSLHERAHSPVPGLVHRYADKVLFLTQDRCPVYCRFCTRSYAVGLDTDDVRKDHVGAQAGRWEQAFDYLRTHPRVEDVVISGGDSYSLRADQVRLIGHALLEIPNIRRMRFATKGLAVMPMKLLTDEDWTSALTEIALRGRKLHKEVAVHTHFNHPREITEITRRAVGRLFEEVVTVRNQCVLLRGVNDHADTMRLLVKRLSWIGVHPYYVFQHDLVTGVSVFRSPNVDGGARYFYFDPIDLLPEEGQERWADPSQHERIVAEAVAAAGG